MERNYLSSPLDFEDEYIPSGNWFPQSFDDEPFFAENCPPNYPKHIQQPDTYHPGIHHNFHQDSSHDSSMSNNPLVSGDENGNMSSSRVDPFSVQWESDHENSAPSNKSRADPFSVQCRIPVPDTMPVSGYQLWLETSFMCRRNERERQRVRSVNDGFSRLRNHLPRSIQIRRRQSKVETLRHAITYIKQLQTMVSSKSDDKP